MKKTMWVTSMQSLPGMLQVETLEAKFEYITMTNSDMTEHQWIKVGECEVFPEFQSTDEVKLAALKATEEAIKKVETEMLAKLHALKAFRSELLCLEAPKPETFIEGEDDDCHF